MNSHLEHLDERRSSQSGCRPKVAHDAGREAEIDNLSSSDGAVEKWDWAEIPLSRQLLLAAFFIVIFLISDGSSTAALAWEGAPPCYLPVGLSLALLICGGRRIAPVVLFASVIAATLNYHRPILSWCGLPGAIAIYLGYVGGAKILRTQWPIDLGLSSLKDIGRYTVVSLGGAVFSTLLGVLTLLGDGRIHRSDIFSVGSQWLASDALALIAFGPFLLVYVSPLVGRCLHSHAGVGRTAARRAPASTAEILELAAQCTFVVGVIWLVFCYEPATPYQPLYLLFVPVIWVAVRRGLRGAVLITFAICVGMTFAAWMTQEQQRSLPRLQLAMLALGLTSLCLGAVVNDRKRGEFAIRKSEKRYRLLFERNMAGFFRTTMSGDVLECNQAAALMFGYESPEEVLAIPASRLYDSASDRGSFVAKLRAEKCLTNHEMTFRRKNGTPSWVMLNVSLVENDAGVANIIEGTLIDITERKAAEKQVQSLAYYDALTGLPNRTLLRDRLSIAIATARRQNQKVALLFLDLDRFKVINDSLGHSVGDLLLKEVAIRLKSCARDQDTVARLGGDEFLIVLTGVNTVHDAAIAAERFMDAMCPGFSVEGHALTIGCSLGISIFPEHGAEEEALMKNADSAMYSAKECGRNTFRFFTAVMNSNATERLIMENALRGAIANNEFYLEYQPQMEMASGKIVGLEALIRWEHPKLGRVPPSEFIPIAESNGLIMPIGEWVLRTACSQVRNWQDEGLVVPLVAVNVSAVQFRQDAFLKTIRRVLRETGLDPQYLELELTESLLLSNADVRVSVLRQLVDLGLKLAIDDFGTGYSSLSYLKQFPVSRLKIDRSFIRDVAVNADDAAITTAIIRMAKSLNLKVMAEGVENEGQLSFLRALECDGIQGYYFSKPLNVGDVSKRLRAALSEPNALPQASGRSIPKIGAIHPGEPIPV